MIPGEEVALQHQLRVCDMMIDTPPKIKRKFTPRPKVWRLRDTQTCSRFQEVFKAHVPAVETEGDISSEEIWAKLKTVLLKTTEEVCGTTKPTDGVVKLGGGIRKWMMPSQPSAELSKHAGWQMHTSII